MRSRLLGALLVLGTVVAACVALERRPSAYFDASKPHHTRNGFRNNYMAIEGSGFWRWQWERWTRGTPQAPPGGWPIPRRTPDVPFLVANKSVTTITWIGHATMLVQLAGRNVLTDPQFSERASPVSFAGPRREVPPALQPADLPHIDVVLISHNHYDHLDLASIEQLARQPGGPPLFYVPLGLRPWFERHGLPAPVELDWWDRRQDGPLAVHAVPVQHWSARTPWDRNQTLWAGYVVQAPDFTFAFLGDTGYSPDFRDIGARFPKIDLALIPIGAYEPRWFMQRQHVDPEQAVAIHRDLHARASIGMHWGTFRMSDEALDEPPRALGRATAASGLPPAAFTTLAIGETRRLAPASPDS